MRIQKLNFVFPDKLFVEELKNLIDRPEKIQLFLGNRGSGKTVFLEQRAIIFALTKKYFRLVYCKKIARNIRDSIFQGFVDVISDWDLNNYFTIKSSEMDIICNLNGNKLLSFGLDDPAKLKAIKDPSHIFWDEMTEGTFQDYAALIGLLRTTKTKKTQFWGTFNPEYGFWGKEYFFLNQDDIIPIGENPARTNDTLLFKATFQKNPFIDVEKYTEQLLELAQKDDNKLIVWIEGNWGHATTGNEYFTMYNKSQHVGSVSFMPGRATHITFDFNGVPYMTGLCAHVIITDTEFQIRFFKEYCLRTPFNTTSDVCRAYIEDYGDQTTDIFYYGDASGKSKYVGLGNRSAFDDVRAGLMVYLSDASGRVLKRNPSVMKRRDFMNNIFAGKVYFNGLKVSILIDNSMKETIRDMQSLKLGADGKLKNVVKDKDTGISYQDLGHTSDAMEYFVIKILWDEFNKSIPK